jgi:23S rRNA (cytidine1920-2'-O)/16S rRNA (cytidine1409-2'-O)-methyltransferase
MPQISSTVPCAGRLNPLRLRLDRFMTKHMFACRAPGTCDVDHVPFRLVKPTRIRLDTLLAERGVFESRSRAAASVLAGDVLVGPARERATKPGQLVASDVEIDVAAAPPFVSRGGVKLANALDAFGLDVSGRNALDVGASTGGFTDCLLQRGAAHVAAVDVAYGELHWRLRSDERVTVIERRNARSLHRDELPYAPDLIVVDVSFISLTKVLPAVLACAAPRFDVLAMVKPQFEVGREAVAKGGVVRDPGARRSALVAVAEAALSSGVSVLGFASSGLPGPKGNLETFVWLAEPGRAGALDAGDPAGLEAAAREVEP